MENDETKKQIGGREDVLSRLRGSATGVVPRAMWWTCAMLASPSIISVLVIVAGLIRELLIMCWWYMKHYQSSTWIQKTRYVGGI